MTSSITDMVIITLIQGKCFHEHQFGCVATYFFLSLRCLSEAHEWNRKRAERALRAGSNPVVIDNTNLESWEMQPYVFMALR